MLPSSLLLVLLVLPFLAGTIVATMQRPARNASAMVAGATMALGTMILCAFWPMMDAGEAVRDYNAWLPRQGINMTLRLDGLSWLFAVMVMGIGFLIVIYARYYLSSKDTAPRFFALLLFFAGAMNGMLLSGNIIVMTIFWEITSLVSFLLIGFWRSNGNARDGARMALIVTGSGGLCLLAAMLIVGYVAGSYDLDRVLASGPVLREHPLYLPALLLFLIGCFTKSAQFPFHFWLPNAMSAPTPVSAYLHSATMVKMGVFLLIRFFPVFGGTAEWFNIVTGAGMATLIVGAVVALFRHDLKGLLAYSTISHLGLITALAGIGSPEAIVAAIFHVINHAIFKASLFMAAGIVDHETGTRDIRKLSGLRRVMPITATLAAIASASMAGVPLLNGFLSKEMFFAEAYAWHGGSPFDDALPYLAVFGSIFSVAYSLRLVLAVFFGPLAPGLENAHEPTPWMRRPAEVLVVLCLAVGILPALTVGPILAAAAFAVLGSDVPYYSLALWHGVNVPLIMSVIAVVAGIVLYAVTHKAIARGPEGPPLLHRIRGARIFDSLMVYATWRAPRKLTRAFGTGRLQPQIRLLILLALGFAAVALWPSAIIAGVPAVTGVNPIFALIWIVGAGCAVGAAYMAKYHRFAALILLGGAGVMTCVTFVWFSAPDLGVTQLLVEVVTTVLLLLGLRWMPRRRTEIVEVNSLRAKLRRRGDLVVAVLCGAGVALMAYTVMMMPQGNLASDWFLQHAYSEGGGTNVVNVILVDFRGFDTFGEICVLAIVGLTIFALLRRFRPAMESNELTPQQRLQNEYDDAADGRERGDTVRDYLMVPSVIMHWMFPVIILLSAELFFRGHDLPGGGFAAGVALAIAFLLQYLAADVTWVEDRLRILPVRWIGAGLLVSTFVGMGSWLFGYPFLTAHSQYLDIPLIGQVPAATALLFDLGVFLVVVGAVVLMQIAIGHQSLRWSRAREKAAEEES
ncbi:monovalent cation/H+ antiporter subunit A [Falsirhodobacter halotolerans]|uniref:monovalent cation/H+ antiporter subunit A n=1 Tax=Falsirhodobacter halotolerans TaxID=1146892 RepID=UPI001FD249FA|nr:monovalent cation/H+ antiporter subunit A [Falsirhodobacter halotolerans]MCJ8139201.1 monovalent cation/H+ antiporter subunit A [Falsirhodobacter halotolerans]